MLALVDGVAVYFVADIIVGYYDGAVERVLFCGYYNGHCFVGDAVAVVVDFGIVIVALVLEVAVV